MYIKNCDGFCTIGVDRKFVTSLRLSRALYLINIIDALSAFPTLKIKGTNSRLLLEFVCYVFNILK